MPSRMIADRSVKYVRMSSAKDDGYIDLQFRTKPPKIPWRSIGVAIIMFIMGLTLLIIGALLVSGHISNKYQDRLWPVILLGLILFIPGSYHVRLALYAYKGYAGYTFDDIPDYDD